MEKQDSFDVSYDETVPVFFCVFRIVIVQNKALHMRSIVGVFTYERSSLERQKHLVVLPSSSALASSATFKKT